MKSKYTIKSPLVGQLSRNTVTAGVSLVVDVGFFVGSIEFLGINKFKALCIGYAAGIIVNYLLSTFWVFSERRVASHAWSFTLFTLISFIGLATELGMFGLFTAYYHEPYLLARIISLGAAYIVNFVTKKYLLFWLPSDELQLLWNAYPRLGDKLYAGIRFITCPFDAVLQALPTHGAMLDIGSGAGILAILAASKHPKLHITGIDIDARKHSKAQFAIQRTALQQQITFLNTPTPVLPEHLYDVITIIDVLYLLNEQEQIALLEDCLEHLSPNGQLLIKEMSRRPRIKFAWNVFQETLSVSVIKHTAGRPKFYFWPESNLAGWLQGKGLVVATQAIDHTYPHPHYLITARKAL